MNKFPPNWTKIKIGQFAKRVNRKNNKQICDNVLTISASDGLIAQKEYFKKIVASKDTSGYTLLENGEFAYNKSYSDGFPVGAARRLRKYSNGIVSPLYICFCINQEILDLRYADYLFKSQWFIDAIYSIAKEGARSHGLLNLGITEFFDASLPVPPLPEQKKIAEILSTNDSIIINSKLKIKKIKSLKIALREKLLSKGLRNENFKDSKLGKIPKTWEIKKLREIGSCIRGLTYSPDDLSDQGLLVLRSSNIEDGNVVFDDLVYVKKDVKSEFISKIGDILICVRNGSRRLLGKSAVITGNLPRATHGAFMTIFRTNQYEFVKYLIESNIFFKQVSRDIGATINSINTQNLLDYEFAFPLIEEQHEISLILSSVDKRIIKEKEYLFQMENLQRSLIQDLLLGYKRVVL